MDISVKCNSCKHRAVCFARREMRNLSNKFYENTVIFGSVNDHEHFNEQMDYILADACRFYKREKEQYA